MVINILLLIRSFENHSCSLKTDSASEDSESVDTRNVDKEKSSGIFDTNNVIELFLFCF